MIGNFYGIYFFKNFLKKRKIFFFCNRNFIFPKKKLAKNFSWKKFLKFQNEKNICQKSFIESED